ncbi:alpha-fucosidase [Clostridiales bacterium COT073_COT-073]|nr:alpha-fucosidase [Clostridiales bacterium COT073_COT-073]
MKAFDKEEQRLVRIVPSPRQLAYQQREFYGFIHFTINTYTDMEWGMGNEDPAIFEPTELDVMQWAKTAQKAGMKGLILTCKHHDGFCLWPSAYTQHSIRNSPYQEGKGDIVRELAEACAACGLHFGIYLSPWDRNHRDYGSGKAYDDYYTAQLTELLTNYGPIYTVWMDGACGEGPNGKVQVYDWERYYQTVRRLQPDAVLSISGPDVRWCGNEAGMVRSSEWSVVAKDMTSPALTAALSQQADTEEFRVRPLDPKLEDLGSRFVLKNEQELAWYPAETDVSIRPGWFYHPAEDDRVRSLENLKEIYLNSVGGNTTLLLNMSPMKNGKLHPHDVKRLHELGDFISHSFQNNLAEAAELWLRPTTDIQGRTGHILLKEDDCYFEMAEGEKELEISLSWPKPVKASYLVLKENIKFSQRVESFEVYLEIPDQLQTLCCQGTTIGYKKIIRLGEKEISKLTVKITEARVCPLLSFVGVY